MGRKKKVIKNENRYDCPQCGKDFAPSERVGKACPHCKTQLKAVRKKKIEGPGFYYEYMIDLDIPQPIKPQSTPPAQNGTIHPDDEGIKLVSRPGEVPQVWLLNPGEKTEHSDHYRSEWRVAYRGIIHTDWVYCPNCHKSMFQNRIINSGINEQVHVCTNNRCKAKVSFYFEANMMMGFGRRRQGT